MKVKQVIKIGIDTGMAVLLFVLMAWSRYGHLIQKTGILIFHMTRWKVFSH